MEKLYRVCPITLSVVEAKLSEADLPKPTRIKRKGHVLFYHRNGQLELARDCESTQQAKEYEVLLKEFEQKFSQYLFRYSAEFLNYHATRESAELEADCLRAAQDFGGSYGGTE